MQSKVQLVQSKIKATQGARSVQVLSVLWFGVQERSFKVHGCREL